MKLFISVLLLLLSVIGETQTTITFPSTDKLMITADVYMPHNTVAPFIVLFHQAGWSRGEYQEIAPKLNKLGFNCMAIDQRSGDKINGVVNDTHLHAIQQKLATTYIDALPDMLCAIDYARDNYAKGKLIIWGSSYSSALVLKIMGDHPDLCEGGLAFAPGEYYERLGKPADFIGRSAKNITKPVFITSAKAEKENWWEIFQSISTETKDNFIPSTKGNHGSRALWEKFDDHGAYWDAVTRFLKSFKN